MDANDTERLILRGQLAELEESIERISREFYNLLRPLRDRLYTAYPMGPGATKTPAVAIDLAASRQEFDSLADVDARLGAAVREYNAVAARLGKPQLAR